MNRMHSRSFVAALAGLSLGAVLSPATAQAAGFVGSFDPSNWTLVNTSDDGTTTVIDQTLVGADAICGATNTVACVTYANQFGDAELRGSTASGSPAPSGGGDVDALRTTTWQFTNPNPPGWGDTTISFSWLFTGDDSGSQTASYLLNGSETILSSTSTGSPATITSLLLAPGQTFGFRITTYDNRGAPQLNISSFSASAPVPGPLPMAGGAAAFAWSRRLRQRIRQARL